MCNLLLFLRFSKNTTLLTKIVQKRVYSLQVKEISGVDKNLVTNGPPYDLMGDSIEIFEE